MNGWVFGVMAGAVPALPAAAEDRPSSLRATFTGPPPTLLLAGDIDEWTYPDLTRILDQVAGSGPSRVHIDLASVEYCDVAGLRAILGLAGRPGDGRPAVEEIVIARLPPPLRRVLRILGWDAAPGVVLDGCAR